MTTFQMPQTLAKCLGQLVVTGLLSERRVTHFQAALDTYAGLMDGTQFVNKTEAKDARSHVFSVLRVLRDSLNDAYRAELVTRNDGPVMELYYTMVDSIPTMATWVRRAKAAQPVVSAACSAELGHMIGWYESLMTVMNKTAMANIGSGVDPAKKAAAAEARRQAELDSGKTVMSCSCCLRGIAIRPDHRMHHHGYERPGLGYQTASCMGIGYRPLEESVDGARAVASYLATREINLTKTLRTTPKLKTLYVQRSFPKAGGKRWETEARLVTIDPTDATWAEELASHIARIERELAQTKTERIAFDAIVAAWHEGMTGAEAFEVARRARA